MMIKWMEWVSCLLQEVTSNIFLQSCVDFLAVGNAKSDGRVQAPVAKVSLDEKLSKVRLRTEVQVIST